MWYPVLTQIQYRGFSIFSRRTKKIQAYRGLIERYLNVPELDLFCYDSLASSNETAKALIRDGKIKRNSLIVTDEQSAGKGRGCNAFYSPANTGIYMTLAFKPPFGQENFTLVTTYAAVVCAQAIEKTCNTKIRIKWVNDIFNELGKIGGILTETINTSGKLEDQWIIVGIGINIFEPLLGYPDHLVDHISSIYGARAIHNLNSNDIRAQIIADTVNSFMDGLSVIPLKPHLSEYRQRSFLTNKIVEIEENDSCYKAKVIGTDDDFALHILLEDGTERTLIDGEAKIPSSKMRLWTQA
jgi:BirA family transcriptional regulator, biotin operon repressor / biotin---[acetyl-CoA-carboxylase] ligase